jgi:hypothetical protein
MNLRNARLKPSVIAAICAAAAVAATDANDWPSHHHDAVEGRETGEGLRTPVR